MSRLPLRLVLLLAAFGCLAWGQAVLNLSVSPAGSSTYGQSVTMTVSTQGLGQGATINFLDGTTAIGAATTNSDGVAIFSTMNLSVGNHSLQATYQPATGASAIRSNTVSYTVNKGPTSTSISSAPNASTYGQSVTLTATVSYTTPPGPAPAGTVTFFDGGAQLGTANLAQGSATLTTSTLSAGNHFLTATYNGDATYAASSAKGTTQTVNQAPSATTIASSPNPSVTNQAVTISVTVTGAGSNPTGAVTIFDGQTSLGSAQLSNGSVALQTSTLAVGDHTLTATYAGDSNYTGSTSKAITQTVNKFSTRTTLSVSPNPANTGQPVTLTATVSQSGATGNVTFFDGSNPIGTATLSNGTATTTTSTLAAGTHSLTATYNGDSTNSSSTSPAVSLTVNQTVTPTSTSLTASPNPATVGQSVTLTATVTASANTAVGSQPTGTVTFRDGANPIGTATLSGGSATTSTSTLSAGSHGLTATYNGDSTYGTSTSPQVTEVVNKASTTTSLTASPNPATPGQSVTLSATVTPANATGTVSFSDGTNPIGTVNLVNGSATFSTSSLTTGSHSLAATYNGDASFNGSTSGTVILVVGKASTTTSLTASPNPATLGQPVTLTATVSPSNATGTVSFSDGSNPIGTVNLVNGAASITTSSLATGSHSLAATYSGDSNFNSSTSGAVTLVVGKASTTTSLTATPASATLGQPVTLTATVAPSTATGSVTFSDGANPIGTAPLNGGIAIMSTSTLAAGSHSLTATYSGDSNFNGSTSAAVGVAVGQGSTATSLSVSANPANSGQPVTLNAIVIPTSATGTVTFKDSGATLATVNLVNGSANFTIGSLTAGSHTLTAAYSGDSTFSASTSNTIVEVVNQSANTTTTTLTVSPNPGTSGQPVILNAVVTPATATGTVTFLDGNTTLGTVNLVNGSATFTTSSLSVGSHSLTATYNGDTSDSPSTSAAIAETINALNPTVTLAASPNPANFGQPVTLTITVTPSALTGTVFVSDSATAGNVGGTATLSNGTATLTVSTLTVGSHLLLANYSGPNNLSAQSSPITEIIAKAPTTTTLTLSSTLLTAVVAPSAATGTVTFKDGATTLGTIALTNATATFSIATLAPGAHTLTATYNGDGSYAASTSNTVTVTPGLLTTTTTLAVSPAASTPGQTVTLTATVAPSAATGTVTFLDGGSATLGTAPLNAGTATLTTTTLTSGVHTLTASYSGDSTYGTSTSSAVTATVGLTATKTVLTASPNPSTAGQSVTLTAAVTPSAATGIVTFLDGATTLGTATLSGGTAIFTIATLTAGSHTLTVSYGGDAGNAPGTSNAIAETVNPGPSLQISPGTIPPAFVGAAYSQTFTASGGTPPLTWSLVSGTQELTVTTSGNNGILAGTPKTAGAFPLTIRVQDSLGQANTAVVTLTVNPALPPISITVTQPTTISDQPAPQVTLGTAYPVALNGTYKLTFAPNASGLDSSFVNSPLQFVTGSTTSPAVAIPANSTAPVTLPAVNLGSVAGTITVQLASLTVAGTGQAVPLPSPAPSVAITVPRLAPVIVPGSVKITSITSSGFQVILDASSTPRDLTGATFTFTAAPNATLNGSSQTVSLTTAASGWFVPANENPSGGTFSLTVPFPFTGNTSALGTVSVTLTNSAGTSVAQSGGQ